MQIFHHLQFILRNSTSQPSALWVLDAEILLLLKILVNFGTVLWKKSIIVFSWSWISTLGFLLCLLLFYLHPPNNSGTTSFEAFSILKRLPLHTYVVLCVRILEIVPPSKLEPIYTFANFIAIINFLCFNPIHFLILFFLRFFVKYSARFFSFQIRY